MIVLVSDLVISIGGRRFFWGLRVLVLRGVTQRGNGTYGGYVVLLPFRRI